ncbi:unnamed protein product [Amoebophrya sp. A120]|nr:unnamed protein product [Amoebophrya sp. A120]|eukprot:GSA120T00007320001.1
MPSSKSSLVTGGAEHATQQVNLHATAERTNRHHDPAGNGINAVGTSNPLEKLVRIAWDAIEKEDLVHAKVALYDDDSRHHGSSSSSSSNCITSSFAASKTKSPGGGTSATPFTTSAAASSGGYFGTTSRTNSSSSLLQVAANEVMGKNKVNSSGAAPSLSNITSSSSFIRYDLNSKVAALTASVLYCLHCFFDVEYAKNAEPPKLFAFSWEEHEVLLDLPLEQLQQKLSSNRNTAEENELLLEKIEAEFLRLHDFWQTRSGEEMLRNSVPALPVFVPKLRQLLRAKVARLKTELAVESGVGESWS